MKKVISILVMAVAVMFVAQPSFAQSKAMNKALNKQYKTKMKEYNKGGWQIIGTAQSLDVALLKHYEKLNTLGDNVQEVYGTAIASTKNLALTAAETNLCNSYAHTAGSQIKGRVVNDMHANAIDPTADFDKFYAAYEAHVAKEIKGELQKSFSVVRTTNDGRFEVQTYYLINEDAASKARIRALENAAKESEAAQKYAQKVSDWVNERVTVEE